jgi:hypothetical protein
MIATVAPKAIAGFKLLTRVESGEEKRGFKPLPYPNPG